MARSTGRRGHQQRPEPGGPGSPEWRSRGYSPKGCLQSRGVAGGDPASRRADRRLTTEEYVDQHSSTDEIGKRSWHESWSSKTTKRIEIPSRVGCSVAASRC